MKFFNKRIWTGSIVLSASCFFITTSWAESLPVETNAIDSFSETAKKSESLPPEGAADYEAYQEGRIVTGKPERIKRIQSKELPRDVEKYISASALHSAKEADAWRQVAFVSGSFVPESGVDQRMVADLSKENASEEKYLYGFLLLDEYLSQETKRQLEALGAVILGPHSDMYKVKLPADIKAVEAIAALPYVEWVG